MKSYNLLRKYMNFYTHNNDDDDDDENLRIILV